MEPLKEVVLLTPEFLAKYPDQPEHQTPISQFVYLRTYARYLPKKKRRETWKEVVTRSVTYNVGLYYKYLQGLNRNQLDMEMRLRNEAEALFDANFNLAQFLSGRTTFVGGAETSVADIYPLSNFNCSFTNIETLYDLCSLFYLLLIGTGVGFKCTPEMASRLEPVRLDLEITHDTYRPLYPMVKVDESSLVENNDHATIYIGDSKEGWVMGMKYFLDVLTKEEYNHIKYLRMNYDYVRDAGERLKRFGGTASGPYPLMELYKGIDQMLRNQEDPDLDPIEVVKYRQTDAHIAQFGQLRPIHILSWGNRIGYGVVVGGVRRTAEIFGIGDRNVKGEPELDWECVFAKYGNNGFSKESDFENHEKVGKMLDELGIDKPKWWNRIGERKHAVEINYFKTYFDNEDDAKTYMEGKEGAKYVYPANEGRQLWHRSMSNNSIAFTTKPSRKILNLVFQMMKGEGEPGFVNLRELAIRRLHALGIYSWTEDEIQAMMEKIFMNPCAEIDLWSKGVCNLTTINATAFVVFNEDKWSYVLDMERFKEAQRRSVRAGMRMTLVELEEMPWERDPQSWNKVQGTDRLIGCSLTGWKDAMSLCGYTESQERYLLKELAEVAHEETKRYASELRIPVPLLDTTIKPEGTLSLVAVNKITKSPVSSGLHESHAPHYIRRIRINAQDPLAKTVIQQGWRVFPENGTAGETYEEQMANARTIVVEFPVSSGAKRSKEDSTVEEQFRTYFNFQKHYTAHNSSNTIDIKNDEEWERAEQIVWDNWDQFTAVSFLASDGGTYNLTPLETSTKDEIQKRIAEMQPLDLELLQQNEIGFELEDDAINDPSCSNGVCGVR